MKESLDIIWVMLIGYILSVKSSFQIEYLSVSYMGGMGGMPGMGM